MSMILKAVVATAVGGLLMFNQASAQEQDQIQDQAQDKGISWSNEKVSVSVNGTFEVGYVGRWDGSGLVADDGAQHDIQSAAGAGGTRVGIKASYAARPQFTLIAESEIGINFTGQQAAGSGGDTFYNRHTWVGATGSWGTLIAGKIDGGRAGVLKGYDPFGGYSVASAGSLQVVTSRAEEAIAYVSPSWAGFNATLAYTPNLNGVSDRDLRSPVYAVILAYNKGPLSLTWDHEEEWWNDVSAFTRLKVDVLAASYDFGPIKLHAFHDRTEIAEPVASALAFYHEHKGYMFGMTAPVGQHGLLKASWNRRDSAYIDNTCTKWGVGYQHNLDRRAYLYADYARISNGAGGTCTIAISDEATSADLGQGDLGGYGTQGVDFGVVFKF